MILLLIVNFVFLNILGLVVFKGAGYNNNNNNNKNFCPISQAPPVKWKSYIVFLCAQGCKLRRPTTTSVVGKKHPQMIPKQVQKQMCLVFKSNNNNFVGQKHV